MARTTDRQTDAGALTETTAETTPKAPAARTVRYVINRPYSAGEMPDIVTATVVRQNANDENVLDLAIDAETEVQGVRRSERPEPGTWHEEGK